MESRTCDKNTMEVIKCKRSYYTDNVHLMGHVILDVYCAPNYENGKHFQISIENANNENAKSKICMAAVDNLPVETPHRYYANTYNIATVNVDKQWVDDCYKTYLAECAIADTKSELIKTKPTVKSNFDLFDESAKAMLDKLETECYEDAIQMAVRCVEEYPDNPKISAVMYNCACSWAKLENASNAFTWLRFAQQKGYNNWSHMIADTDFSKMKHAPEFVEIVKTMMHVDPDMNYRSREIVGYLETHDLNPLHKGRAVL